LLYPRGAAIWQERFQLYAHRATEADHADIINNEILRFENGIKECGYAGPSNSGMADNVSPAKNELMQDEHNDRMLSETPS